MSESRFFTRQTTSWGGRGVFASQAIPKDTHIHTSVPYTSIIYREFRKEVCAQCFAYAFDLRKNTWNVRLDLGPGGLWFCGESCRDEWIVGESTGELVAQVNVAVDRLAKSLEKGRAKNRESASTPEILIPEASLSHETLDAAWTNAMLGDMAVTAALDDMELEYARFILSALIRRHAEDTAASNTQQGNSWSDLLELQNNELAYIQSRPHRDALASHLRIFAFIRRAASTVPVLAPYVATSVRAILSRDPGNVFGIYEMNRTGDSEMFGWCMYVSASFFNHDCDPNVKKQRTGRAMSFYTTRDILPGEELCITYVDLEETVQARREQLSLNWYFACVCQRCKSESETS
ncbi:hypothetical protein C8F01DRAFT_1164138 [Mycena amicta]|nr:hypothetical protein C8F01DRAFT_1164138 [Mycena amicta]